MAKILGNQWPVGVCFYVGVGDDVKSLAEVIAEGIGHEIGAERADIDLRLGTAIQQDAEALTKAIQSNEWSILHLVAHGQADGSTMMSDPWGELMVEKEKLSAVVRGHRVKLALVTSCFGAQVAEQLVEDEAVDVAIGMSTPMPFSVALAFSKAFYRSLARGNTIQQAFEDGRAMATLRGDNLIKELKLFSRN